MKKAFALLIGIIILFSFAACGSSEDDASADGASAGDMIVLSINTDGMGQIAYAHEGEELIFNDEFPVQSAQENLTEPTTFVLSARPVEDWQFETWTKDGEDDSTDEEITVDVDASAEYIAYFSVSEQ